MLKYKSVPIHDSFLLLCHFYLTVLAHCTHNKTIDKLTRKNEVEPVLARRQRNPHVPGKLSLYSSNSQDPKQERRKCAVWEFFSSICNDDDKTRRKFLSSPATFSINSATTTLRDHFMNHGFMLNDSAQMIFLAGVALMADLPAPR